MAIEKVRAHFAKTGREDQIREVEASTATVELAAQAIGVAPARIAKTLSFRDGEAGCILVVTAGDMKIDNKKFKGAFGLKAKMLSPQEVLDYTGHAVGGVCPFGIDNPAVRVFLDESLKRFDTVFPAAGSANSMIELSCGALFEDSGAQGWVDVCKAVG
ncbi:MAG: YbaK/EbsC family protein [Eubacterium sp.]|nr:YbaK/EbsC family protein [Eubacterium sp.]